MSHEIRTPLNAILGLTSLLLNTPLAPQQHDFATTIQNSGQTLLDIINDILDFSKIESGKLELERRPLDLHACVEAALDLVAVQAAPKQLELAAHFGPNVPALILGDVVRLRQILVNLLANAIKFTEQGTVVVEVQWSDSRVMPAASPGAALAKPAPRLSDTASTRQISVFLHIAVHDTGIGIAPAQMQRLFRSFSQGDVSTTRKYGGTGLGLAISQRLAELMGGTMWAESTGEPGAGATFHFTLQAPLGRPAPAFMQPPAGFPAPLPVLVIAQHPTQARAVCDPLAQWRLGVTELPWPTTPADWEAAVRLSDERAVVVLEGDAELIVPQSTAAWRAPVIWLANGRGFPAAPPAGWAILPKPLHWAALHQALAAARTGQVMPPTAPTPTPIDSRLAERYPLRVLVVEDNLINRKLAVHFLARLGYQPTLAVNGYAALEALAAQPYDVVLMDVQMPEMDGLEASRRIRQNTSWAQPRIIAMTANAIQGDREECLAAGMDDYVSKPINLTALVAALVQGRTPLPDTAPE